MEVGPRIVIIGNSGSGKTTLATALQARAGYARTYLDRIHWLDKVGVKRDVDEAKALVAVCADKPCWIIEGVYGWLAEAAFPRATTLIWLDMSAQLCRYSLALRGPWRTATAEQHSDFLTWADGYWQRQTSTSFAGHLALFEGFQGHKHRLRERSDVAALIGPNITSV